MNRADQIKTAQCSNGRIYLGARVRIQNAVFSADACYRVVDIHRAKSTKRIVAELEAIDFDPTMHIQETVIYPTHAIIVL